MLSFLANVLEQTDLALDQLSVNDVNYKRFTLMLVDNVVELTLHQYAVEKSNWNEMWKGLPPKYSPKLVTEALGQHFESKVKFAAETGWIPASLKVTVTILHAFRNEVYHRGMAHENILPAISLFYFQNACRLLETFSPGCFGYTVGQHIPHRAKKYLGAKATQISMEDFSAACKRLREISESFESNLIADLASQFEYMIEEADHNIQFLANDSPNEDGTREGALINTQLWAFAFTAEAEEFSKSKNFVAKTPLELLDWLKKNCNWKYQKEPIPGWRKRLADFRKKKDPHRALLLYKNFVEQTEEIRAQLHEAAASLDSHIQSEINIARGK